MFFFRGLIATFFLYSINIPANEYLPNNLLIDSLINQKSCSLSYRKINPSDEDTIDILKISDINSNDWKVELAYIKPLLDQGNLSCFLKVNITAIYAQKIYAEGDLINAETLFSKTLSYNVADTKFKKSIRSKLQTIQSEVKLFESSSISPNFDTNTSSSNLALDLNKSDSIPTIRYYQANQDINYEEENIALQESIKSLKMQLDASIDSEADTFFIIESLKNDLFAANVKISDLTKEIDTKINSVNKLNQNLAQALLNADTSNEGSSINELSFSYLNLFLFTTVIILITAMFANLNSTSLSSASEPEPKEPEPEEPEPKEPEPKEPEPTVLEITEPNAKKDLHDNEKLLTAIQFIIGGVKISLADGLYFYGYFQGISENIILDTDNELESSYLMDRLINTCFTEVPVFIKSYYRFMESDEIISGKKDGFDDVTYFYEKGKLEKLPKLIESKGWEHIFDNKLSNTSPSKKDPAKTGKITGIGGLPRD